MNDDVSTLADEIVATHFRHSPLSAFLMGLDDVEGTLEDLSEGERGELIARYQSISARSRARLEEEAVLDQRDVLTLDHIAQTSDAYAERLASPSIEFTITNFSTAPFAGLISVLPQLPIGTPARCARYLACLGDIPRFLDQAAARHREGISAGLTPTARGTRYALEQIDRFLSMDDYSGVRRQSVDLQFAGDQDRMIADFVVPAVMAYRGVIEHELAPHGRPDERCGLHWLPGGAEIYEQRVRQYTWSTQTPQEVHDLGLSLISRLQAEFVEVGGRLWGVTEFEEVRGRLVSDPELRFDTSDEILATAIAAVRHAEEVAPRFFGVVPKEPCSVSPIPDALAESAAVAYYYGGAVDGSRPGTYFVNTSKPTKRARYSAEAVAFHEAVPGHHFQLTIAQEFGAHLVYRVTRDVANSEGWGLYTERLADEMGLYSSDVARLGMLTADAMRAARLVVDTGLHALGWSRQEAIDWMISTFPMPEIEVIQETDRYIMAPGQALAYMFGRLEIEATRRRASERLGGRFELREFHDMVLATGPIALPAFSAAADRWVESKLAR
jgi:uncharacterized protein (DUF885 family)